MAQDWDNLVILDACRYDLFEEVNTIGGDLSATISRGSSTGEFLKQNFGDQYFPDTVYVCANPQLESRNLRGQFHADIPLWVDHWDDDYKTVLPDAVTNEALAAEIDFPRKRLIIHFLQPHFPFIGKTGREIEHGTVAANGVISKDREIPSIWVRLENGDIEASKVWKAYRENLELALPHVEHLAKNLDGKTVITSDHGNAFGEWGIYGHPSNYYIDELVTVPWFVLPWSTRKSIESGTISDPHVRETDVDVSKRLEHLGYADES